MGEHGDSSGDAVCRRPRDSIAGDLRIHTAIRHGCYSGLIFLLIRLLCPKHFDNDLPFRKKSDFLVLDK